MRPATRALALVSLAAWAWLAWAPDAALPALLCSGQALPRDAWPSGAPASLAWAPGRFAGSALMVMAMMLPLAADPLEHLLARSFASRRPRAAALFLTGYCLPWMAAGWLLQLGAHRLAGWLPAGGALMLAIATALAWQFSPAKQLGLNACHRRPGPGAFGWRADGDALRFGAQQATACAASCWALMLIPPLLGRQHLAGMLVVSLFALAERCEPAGRAGWRWRLPTRALHAGLLRLR